MASTLKLLACLFFLPFLSTAKKGQHRGENHIGTNVIDSCWRNNRNWAKDRPSLAMCSVGFAGKMNENQGPDVTIYVVTDSSDNPTKPRAGTLRFAATLIPGKVWITFQKDMTIKLHRPLYVSSYTAIDGRGANVHIAYGSGFVLERVNNVIIHGLNFHDIQPTMGGSVVYPGGKVKPVHETDGDAIRLITAVKVWIDHNTLYKAQDGLVDVTHESNMITISNNLFKEHDKVMLLGHNNAYVRDKRMHVTLVYNHFGPNCVQRMPRIRNGYVHIVNNLYAEWLHYAIGGSADPTIMSQANLYVAPIFDPKKKGIIWRESGIRWHLKSLDDVLVNGAFFSKMADDHTTPEYDRHQRFPVGSGNDVVSLTKDAGALRCFLGKKC